MKLLYIWIEEFRNIAHQGITVDDEYIITVNNPDIVTTNYYNKHGSRLVPGEYSSRFDLKVFERQITCTKNHNYSYSQCTSSIRSISALVGKNAVGKSNILECLYSQENEYCFSDNRHYFLVFLDEIAQCIEIRSRGIHIKAENIERKDLRTHDSYARYIIPLEYYSPACSLNRNENTRLVFLTTQGKGKPYVGYDILDLHTIVGTLNAFDKYNSHEGVFDFLCTFPRMCGENSKLVIFLQGKNDERHWNATNYFTNSEYSPEQYKLLFIYKLAKVLFHNLRSYLYHAKQENRLEGFIRPRPNEEMLLQEDKQCAKLLSFVNIPYPSIHSPSFKKMENNSIPQEAIESALNFFAVSTFSFMGKRWYDDYIVAIRELFNLIIEADSNLFTALYKIEIPFERRYKPIVAAVQKCINLDSLGGEWTSGIHVDFEWFSSGEYHLAMLFSAIYQWMSEEKEIAGNTDVIWFIDEPEMHMHPELGRTFLDILSDAMRNFNSSGFVGKSQFLLATHSPFIIQNLSNFNSLLTLVRKNDHQTITLPFENLPLLKLPHRDEFSFNLIMHKIFDVPTIELHNELYGVLQEINHCYTEAEIERWFVSRGISKTRDWIKESRGVAQEPYAVTLQTYIRNSIHHPENRSNPNKYADSDLRASIETMINLL